MQKNVSNFLVSLCAPETFPNMQKVVYSEQIDLHGRVRRGCERSCEVLSEQMCGSSGKGGQFLHRFAEEISVLLCVLLFLGNK